jgi:hypothetical protein
MQEAELCGQQAQQRLLELTGLVLEGDLESLTKIADAYEAKVNRALKALERVGGQQPEQATQLAWILQRDVFDQAGLLSLLVPSLPDRYHGSIQGALQISQMGEAALQTWLAQGQPAP